jgi:acyl carrier protein
MKQADAAPTVQALETWLIERLATELGIDPAAIDLNRNADSHGIDSMVAVQICADLGHWIQGRELSPDVLWEASSLRALCHKFAVDGATAIAAPTGDRDANTTDGVDALGAALFHANAGRTLVPLYRADRLLRPGQRSMLTSLPTHPNLVSVAYRHVDEATGEPRGSTYYSGKLLHQIRPWITPVATETGLRHQLYVINDSDQTLAITIAAWACADDNGVEETS